MANPGTMFVNVALTEVSAGYTNEAFVADRVFPSVDSPKIAAKIFTVDPKRTRFRLEQTLRAPGAPARIVDIRFDKATPTDNPIDIIRDAKADVGGQVQRQANCVLVGQAVHTAICQVVRDNLKYVSGQSITEQMLKNLSELDDYIVGRASYNSAKEDATPTMTRLWPTEYMLVSYRPPRPSRKTPALGYSAVPKNMGQRGVIVEREQLGQARLARQVTVHRWFYDYLMMAAAGQLHTNCVGAS
ncbi:MAG: hypothetical protein FJ291_24225 [Planctomycetes bacterium]|nr:hypothetical protein [Planctomycetota bacterium]